MCSGYIIKSQVQVKFLNIIYKKINIVQKLILIKQSRTNNEKMNFKNELTLANLRKP